MKGDRREKFTGSGAFTGGVPNTVNGGARKMETIAKFAATIGTVSIIVMLICFGQLMLSAMVLPFVLRIFVVTAFGFFFSLVVFGFWYDAVQDD